MKRYGKIRMAALALASAVLLGGCQIGDTQVVLVKPISFREVFKIDEEVCTKKEAMVYLTNYVNIYGRAYGIDLWKSEADTKKVEQYIKDVTVSHLAKVKCMNGIAKEQDMKLTKEEKKKISRAADTYDASLSKEDRKYLGIHKSDIEKMYQEYWLAVKVHQSLIGSVDEEVSDDEARVMEAMQIFVKEASKAKEVEERLKNGEDFAAIAGTYNEKDRVEVTFGREDVPKEVEQVAFELENEEISEAIQTKEGYYFIKCVNKYNQELTDKNKEVILENRKEKAFHDVYDSYIEKISTVFNDRMWEKVEVEPDEKVGTDRFFEVIDEAIQGE